MHQYFFNSVENVTLPSQHPCTSSADGGTNTAAEPAASRGTWSVGCLVGVSRIYRQTLLGFQSPPVFQSRLTPIRSFPLEFCPILLELWAIPPV